MPKITEDIEKLVAKAQGEIDKSIADDTRRVGNARDGATTELGEMFTQSSEGMRTAARDVVRNGKQTLDQQKTQFSRAQAEAGNRISGEIEQGLALVARGVDASTRDIEAAGTLLTADLRKVLLDLGERRENGGGLLGAMSTGAATAGSADYQLAQATRATTAYANVRGRDIAGILLRQAQTDAAMQMLAEMPAFEMDLPSGTAHRTVYNFSIGAGE
jgi:hypothetical protein